jgi:hypothetical protein
MYDPILGRFLSPDKYVQAPGFTQSYNRYSYCLNNPLAFTDPSGYLQTELPLGGRISFDNSWIHTEKQDGGAGAGREAGGPGDGDNGLGLDGVYFDWTTGTYRSVASEQILNGPLIFKDCIIGFQWNGYEPSDDCSLLGVTCNSHVSSDFVLIAFNSNAQGQGGSDFLDKVADFGGWADIALTAPTLGTDQSLKVPAKAQAPGYNLANEIKVNNAMKTASKYLDGAGKALGVVSYIDHTNKAWQSMQTGHIWEGLGYYGLSIIDVAVWFNKKTNPYVLGSIFVYDIVDATAF